MFKSKFQVVTIFFIISFLHILAGIYYNDYSPWWLVALLLFYLLLLFLGSFFIRWNFYLKSLEKISNLKLNMIDGEIKVSFKKNAALTFDDGPGKYTAEILDILKKENIKATFFVIGNNIKEYPEVMERMVNEGHSIGNHSYYHGKNFDWQSAKKMRDEIEMTNQEIELYTHAPVRIFRPPYGVTNPNLEKALEQTEMKSIAWSLRSYDTVATSPEKLLKKIKSKVKPSSIILLHDSVAITKDILPELIQHLKSNKYELETIS